jgi:hypothetical protein
VSKPKIIDSFKIRESKFKMSQKEQLMRVITNIKKNRDRESATEKQYQTEKL